MKLLLIGAGSIGAYFCGRAASGGAEVEVLVRRNAPEIREKGYDITSIAGNFVFHPARVIDRHEDISPDIDAVVLATKVLPDVNRVELVREAAELPHHPPVVLLQNGIGIEDEIASAFPDNEIISCVAYIGASRKSFREILHTGSGRLIIGRFGGGDSPFARQLAGVFISGGVPCRVTEDIALERWRKLLWNLPFNPVSVLAGGLDTRELCDGRDIEKLCSELMDEVILCANASGVKLTRAMADEQFAYTRDFPPYKTSMLQDYSAGLPLEVDAVLGNMLKIADRFALAVPYSRCCAALLRSLDRKKQER
ncbi:MAG: 2-dehydropantoate 2-reductase [Lentisphaerae bacterium]|nr:2-dehydropantoate 2-reductase [Lentisphaerota bacterium]